MNWYAAKLVYHIICGRGEHAAQFDEQLRLVQAANEQDAFEKAMEIGVAEQEVFCNDKHELVQWKFINVPELFPLPQLTHGAELYARVNEVDDAAAYIHNTDLRAETIRDKTNHEQLQLI